MTDSKNGQIVRGEFALSGCFAMPLLAVALVAQLAKLCSHATGLDPENFRSRLTHI
jgi:hypothetical protein